RARATPRPKGAPPPPAGPLSDNGADGSPPDLDSANAGTAAEASNQHAPASATFYQDSTTASDDAFYALSSDAYWSSDEGVGHRLAELGADGHDGELASIANGSDAVSPAGFGSPHFTFNDGTSVVSSNAPAASGAPI